jgi:hypothetical protein
MTGQGTYPYDQQACGLRRMMMTNGNVIRKVYNSGNDNKRVKVYYDRKPSTSIERDNRICMVLNSTGQTIRLNESDAFDLLLDMTKVLKEKHARANRYAG